MHIHKYLRGYYIPKPEGAVYMPETRPVLTFGQQAVGVNFNPAEHPQVKLIKDKAAELIDILNDQRKGPEMLSADAARALSIAITDIEQASMWAVKAQFR